MGCQEGGWEIGHLEEIITRLIGKRGCPRFAGGGWDTVKGEGVEDISSESIDVGGGVYVAGDEEGAGHLEMG